MLNNLWIQCLFEPLVSSNTPNPSFECVTTLDVFINLEPTQPQKMKARENEWELNYIYQDHGATRFKLVWTSVCT
jgi:hypothetical protein